MADKSTIKNGLELNDKHITVGFNLLHSQFPTLVGLQCFQKVTPIEMWVENYLQVLHYHFNHWITVKHWVVRNVG